MGRPKLYTEEELKERKRERNAEWRTENPDYQKKWYQENREKRLEKCKAYSQEHKKEKAEYEAKRYQENREKILERQAEYRKTKMGRASYLVKGYKAKDEKYNRGKCTLIPQWIIENIFSKPCHYCGKEGWEIMGCDRVDNSKPHTPDNVVPCCAECNRKRGSMSYEAFVSMFKINELWQN